MFGNDIVVAVHFQTMLLAIVAVADVVAVVYKNPW